MLEIFHPEKVEKLALKCWKMCLEQSGAKGQETYEMAIVMRDFYMNAEIDEKKSPKFELFVLDFK